MSKLRHFTAIRRNVYGRNIITSAIQYIFKGLHSIYLRSGKKINPFDLETFIKRMLLKNSQLQAHKYTLLKAIYQICT